VPKSRKEGFSPQRRRRRRRKDFHHKGAEGEEGRIFTTKALKARKGKRALAAFEPEAGVGAPKA